MISTGSGTTVVRPLCMTVGTDQLTLGDLIHESLGTEPSTSQFSDAMQLVTIYVIVLHYEIRVVLTAVSAGRGLFEISIPLQLALSVSNLGISQSLPHLRVLTVILVPDPFAVSTVWLQAILRTSHLAISLKRLRLFALRTDLGHGSILSCFYRRSGGSRTLKHQDLKLAAVPVCIRTRVPSESRTRTG